MRKSVVMRGGAKEALGKEASPKLPDYLFLVHIRNPSGLIFMCFWFVIVSKSHGSGSASHMTVEVHILDTKTDVFRCIQESF